MGGNGDESSNGAKKGDYYNSGSSELATETALTMHRLETRRKLTKDSNRLVIVLVGLPARGKSFVARKLLNFLEWHGFYCRIFNVGRYRRQAYAEVASTADGACDADFFDSKNEQAAALREKVAEAAMNDMLRWLDDEDDGEEFKSQNETSRSGSIGSGTTVLEEGHNRIAIFDATNSTKKRRQWILEECSSPQKRRNKPTGCVFVESICDDEELLMENFRFKISNSPDYQGMSQEAALADLKNRVKKYEEAYETIDDDNFSYIKIFNLSSKLLVNHIYGRMAKSIVPALMAWNIGTRPVFLCRPGQTLSNVTTDSDDYVKKVNVRDSKLVNMSGHSRRRLLRGDSLGPGGKKFSDAVYDFVFEECMRFISNRSSIMDNSDTGTSISGLARHMQSSFEGESRDPPFPLKIFTSTMPRAAETVRWDEYDFRVDELSSLNPLDKGDFVGKELEELQKTNPLWYSKLERDAFTTRFPGGESYKDLIQRLEPVVVDLEQQVVPTLVVSHVSVLQMLMAYFRKSPVEKAMEIEVPLHTVIKFAPARGGGWSETQHPLAVIPNNNTGDESENGFQVDDLDQVAEDDASKPTPIWGDHKVKI